MRAATKKTKAPAADESADLSQFLGLLREIRRDLNATVAMHALLSNVVFNPPAEEILHKHGFHEDIDKRSYIVGFAYAMADHMEAARNEKGGAR